jgi:hypothetical protein
MNVDKIDIRKLMFRVYLGYQTNPEYNPRFEKPGHDFDESLDIIFWSVEQTYYV